MRLFSCQSCDQILFFENVRCERCQHQLGFWAEDCLLSAIEPTAEGADTYTALGVPDRTFRLCANAQYGVCNWLVDATGAQTMCDACRHNQVIPELNSEENRIAWRKIEIAKHRLFYTLYRLGLAQSVDLMDPSEPLVFQFLADLPAQSQVMTGHDNGLITIALSEADDVEREHRRKMMHEPYRTLLGHFRHEVGHFFWDRVVRDANRLEACRAVFGDDTADYAAALQTHYDQGPPADWQQNYVSAYATAHPWEDFAETWAHYLHIVDTLEMARSFGMTLAPAVDKEGAYKVDYALDPYAVEDIQKLVDVWVPVSMALNSVNRAMGKEEIYPFILSPGVIAKLDYMRELIRDAVATPNAPAQPAPADPPDQPLASGSEAA